MKKIIAAVLIIATLFCLVSCSPQSRIEGTWVQKSNILGIEANVEYVFRDDGTGTITGAKDLLTVNFTYTFAKDKLFITTSVLGVETTEEYSYEFEKDRLLLRGDQNLNLERVEE